MSRLITLSALALIALAPLGAGGCASGNFAARPAMSAPAAEASASMYASDVPAAESIARKILRSADMSLDVDDIDEAGRHIVRLTTQAGGFVLTSSRMRYQVKVPAQGFDAALERFESLGELTRRSLYGEDVSAEYVDLEVRLRNAQAARDSYAQLLAKAQTVEDMLKVQQALGDVQERIERLEGRRQFLDQHLALSDVTIDLREARSPGPLQLLWNVVTWPLERLWWL